MRWREWLGIFVTSSWCCLLAAGIAFGVAWVFNKPCGPCDCAPCEEARAWPHITIHEADGSRVLLSQRQPWWEKKWTPATSCDVLCLSLDLGCMLGIGGAAVVKCDDATADQCVCRFAGAR